MNAVRVFACLAVVAAFAAPARPAARSPVTPQARTDTAAIRGRVVDADTGTPVRAAAVTLSSQERGRWDATTDDAGLFAFTGLPAGRYSIRVSKAGFVPTSFGAPVPRGARSSFIDIAAGQQVDRGDLPLPRGGVIAGRIFDDYGEPVAEIIVSAFRSEYRQPGERRLAAVRTAQTDDRGDFRIFGLAPGRYYVAASTRVFQVAGTGGDGSPAQGFVASVRGPAPTFYPGTAIATDAQPVVVTVGAETTIAGLRLQSVPLARIAGAIVDSAGRPARDVVVMINPARADGALINSINVAEADAAGRFTIPNVAPGDYRIDVEPKARLEAMGTTGSAGVGQAVGEFASVPVTVSGQDVEGLVLETSNGFRMAGRVVVEGSAATPDVLARMRVDVLPVIEGQGISALLQSRSGQVGPEGLFVVNGLIGMRLVRVGGLPAGWALKGVRAGGIDVTDAGFEISGNLDGVEVVVTARPTEITGQVVDERGQPVGDCEVAIFPEDSRYWTVRLNRLIASTRADASGRFRVTALPAGRYLAIAVDALEDGEWAEPEHLERLRARATPFALADGEAKALTLTIVGR